MKRLGLPVFMLVLVSCADQRSSGGPSLLESGAVQCPDDYIAYDFGKSPIQLDSEYYQAALGPNASVPYYTPSGIKVMDVQCWQRDDCGLGQCYPQIPEEGNKLDRTLYDNARSLLSLKWERKVDAATVAQYKKDAEKECNGLSQCSPETIGFRKVDGKDTYYNDWCQYTYTCEYDPNVVQKSGGPSADGHTWNGPLVRNPYKYFPKYERADQNLSCMGNPEIALRARREAREKATACVPKTCRGKTHRSANLDCVADAAMPVYSLASMKVAGPSTFTTDYNPVVGAASAHSTTLYNNAIYKSWASVDYGAAAPKEARLLYWLSDVYVPKSVDVPAGANLDDIVGRTEVKEAFRCTALTLDVGRPAGDDTATKVAGQNSTQLSPECFQDSRVVENLAAITGQAKPLDTYKYLGTRLNRSLDVIGRTVILAGPVTDANVASSCAPNPPEFYFDTKTSTYDMVSYYKQRQIDSLFQVNDAPQTSKSLMSNLAALFTGNAAAAREFGGKGTWVTMSTTPAVLRMGPQEVRTSIAEVQVTTSKGGTTELPVDVSWFVAHMSADHLFDPANRVSNYDSQADEPAVQPVMSFYLWPTSGGATGEMPKLGEIALDPKGASPDGKTDSGVLTFPAAVRASFFKKDSPMFVTSSAGMRSFELVACLDVRLNPAVVRPWTSSQNASPQTQTDGRFFASTQKLTLDARATGRSKVYRIGKDGRPTEVGSLGKELQGVENPLFQLALGTGYDDAAFTPWQGFGPGQACRVASTPIIVHALSLSYPAKPQLQEPDTDDSSDTASGSNDMAASQGSDSETTCKGGQAGNCTEAQNSNMESSGNMGRSFYSSDSSFGRDFGTKVNVDSKSEMLGMQLVDLADPMGEEEEYGWPKDPKSSPQGSTPVTLTIAPPWDDIVDALRKSSAGKGASDWKKGKYAGIMGLGLGIGYKTPITIGPIPGLITITVSAGLATELVTELQFAPKKGDDDYFCEGTEDCVGIETEARSFLDARAACANTGGRLAELGSSAEAAKVIDLAKMKKGKYWLGGQQAYAYKDPQCATAYNAATCGASAVSSWRWLSNDAEFAYADGQNTATWRSGKLNGTAQQSFKTTLPVTSGLLYDAATDTVSLAPFSEAHQYLCRYEAVDDYAFFRWSVAANLGVAAGIGLSFCVPSDDPGVCLGGSLNIVSLHLTPTYENKYYWLYKGNHLLFTVAGFTEAKIPWGVTLLEGSIYAQINAWIFSLQWNILEFEGFKIKEAELIEPKKDQFRLSL